MIILGLFSPVLHKNASFRYSLDVFHPGVSNEYLKHTPQPLYNTIVGVHTINRVS